ncbi:YfgM family protein [Candidatus Gillettellia adelgis]
MTIYRTERKILEILCQFFTKKKTALILGIVFGLLVLSGWYYWRNHQDVNLIAVSQAYQEINAYLQIGQIEDIVETEKFIKNNNNSYGVFAALKLARYFVKHNDFTRAEQQLLKAHSHTTDNHLISQINIRLARIQIQKKKWDYAINILDQVKSADWAPIVQEMRGDVLLAIGDFQGAREAYSNSVASNSSEVLRMILRIKLHNLPN